MGLLALGDARDGRLVYGGGDCVGRQGTGFLFAASMHVYLFYISEERRGIKRADQSQVRSS